MDFLSANPGKFLQQFFLSLVKIYRCLDLDYYQLVTPAITLQCRHAFVAQPEDLSGLGTFRDLHGNFSIQSRDLYLAPNCRLGKTYRDFAYHIIPVPGKDRMRANVYGDIEIAVLSTLYPLAAFTTKFQPVAGFNSGGIFTEMVFLSFLLPAPRQSGQGLSTIRPSPPHWLQGLLTLKYPC